jgi:flagellar biosynthesis protein FliP
MNTTHPLWFLIAGGLLGLIPLCVSLLTSYLKVSIVIGMLKSGLGVQHAPGLAAEMALSLAITAYVMAPVIEGTTKVPTSAFEKIVSAPPAISLAQLEPIIAPWRAFLVRHAGREELAALRELHARQSGKVAEDDATPIRVLLPAFVLAELREAFTMGFALLLPFLAIDLIVANLLAGMGMFMVSPSLITLPLKLILFVMADGWMLLTRALILSYEG